MASNSNGSYTFYPEFAENIILYRGCDQVILGDGTGGYKEGWLYTKFVDENVKELGPISAYALAVENGYNGSLSEWVNELASSSINSQEAKSAKDIAVQAKEDAIAAKGQAVQAQNNAEAWATGGSNGVPSATNNASYYSLQASQALTGAQNAEQNARAWATGLASTGEPSSTNNAMYYSNQAIGAAEEAQNWANGGSNGTPSSANNAKFFADQAHVWTTGSLTDNGTGGAQNNAKYFATQAEQWATGSMGGTPGLTNNAKYYADQAKDMHDQTVVYYQPMEQYAQQVAESVGTVQDLVDEAELWATGGTNGTASSENNAKFFSDLAKTYSENIESVEATTLYYNNGLNGSVPPADGPEWVETPSPVNGRYIWAKTTFAWGDGTTSVVYNVGYIGANGTGSVDSVNGLAGAIIVDGSNIYYDANEQDQAKKKTLQQYLSDLEEDLQEYADAAGSVKDVNGVSPVEGSVILDASDIYVNKNEQVQEGESRQTLMEYITSIEPVYATNEEIDALFEEEEVGA